MDANVSGLTSLLSLPATVTNLRFAVDEALELAMTAALADLPKAVVRQHADHFAYLHLEPGLLFSRT